MSIIYPPIIIVNTIINEFFKVRGVKYDEKLSDDHIIEKIANYGHIKIQSDKIVVVLADKDHKCSKEKQSFIEMFKFMKDIPSTVEELIIVLDRDILLNKKNIVSEIGELVINYPKLRVVACPFERFTFNILKHKDVAEYKILSKSEITELTQIKHLNLNDLKVILETDPPMIWIGARKGDVVECRDKSLTAVMKIEYYNIK